MKNTFGAAALIGAIGLGVVTSNPDPAEAYPDVNIRNNTKYKAVGKVTYAGCSNDNYSVDSGKLWTANSRGLFGWCLVTGVTAEVDGKIDAESYGSSGTGYAAFKIQPNSDGYIVKR